MIYLVSKIIISLLASLGIGFGMAWMLQMHLAGRLREQLNSVIFETKSRIPQLESEITNRDQAIDGLREELAQKAKPAPVSNSQAGNKEQEKQIDELRQKIIDLENELRMARGVVDEEAVFEIPEEDQVVEEETELMSDDEFLTDIQDIFEDADDSTETFGGSSSDSGPENATKDAAQSAEDSKKSIEDELQSELDSWSEEDSANKDKSSNVTDLSSAREHTAAPRPEEEKIAKPPLRAGSVDLKAELQGLQADSATASGAALADDETNVDVLRAKVESLAEARKALNDIVDSQAREMSGMQQKSELQDKSLTVLNQQLELARIANERILRELREVKDGKSPADDESRTATGG